MKGGERSLIGKKTSGAGVGGQLHQLAMSAANTGIHSSVKVAALEYLNVPSERPGRKTAILELMVSPAFAALGTTEQKRLLELVGGDTPFSPEARLGIARTLSLERQEPKGLEARDLRRFMRSIDCVPPYMNHFLRDKPRTRRSYEIRGPVERGEFEFVAGKRPALRYNVHIGKHVTSVTVPENGADEGFVGHTLEQMAQAIASVPDKLPMPREIFIEPRPREDPPATHMMCAPDGLMIAFPDLKPTPQNEIDDTLIHEIGHMLSMGAWGAREKGARWDRWRQAMRDDVITPSLYGQLDIHDDFAETFSFYARMRGTEQEAAARALFPRRFALIDSLLPKPV